MFSTSVKSDLLLILRLNLSARLDKIHFANTILDTKCKYIFVQFQWILSKVTLTLIKMINA